MKKRNKSHTMRNPVYLTLLTAVSTLVIFVILALISSLALVGASDPLRWLGGVFAAIFIASGAIASFAATRLCRDFGFYPSLFSSLIIILILFCAGLILGGEVSFYSIILYAAHIAASAIASRLALCKTKRRRRAR